MVIEMGNEPRKQKTNDEEDELSHVISFVFVNDLRFELTCREKRQRFHGQVERMVRPPLIF